MSNDLSFHNALLSCIKENVKSGELSKSSAFRSGHITKEGDHEKNIVHRSRQWIHDLTKTNKPPILKIEDLQAACEVLKISPENILPSDEKWNKEIKYIDKSFVYLLDEISKINKDYFGFFMPVRYNPTTSTVLALVFKGLSDHSKLHKKTSVDNAAMVYVVFSLRAIAAQVCKASNKSNREKILEYANYYEACNAYTSICNFENNENETESFRCKLSRCVNNIYITSNYEKKEVNELFGKQNIFNRFFTSIMFPTGEGKKRALDDTIALSK